MHLMQPNNNNNNNNSQQSAADHNTNLQSTFTKTDFNTMCYSHNQENINL